MKRITGLVLALVLFTAFASVSRADGLTNTQVLDSLNVAHTKFDAGDKPGAKAELSALSAKLASAPTPQHKDWRRKVQWIVLKLTVGFTGSAETSLHDLLKEVSSASSGNQPTPPQPAPPGF